MKTYAALAAAFLFTLAGRGASPSTNALEGPAHAPALPPVEARSNPPSTNGPAGPGPVHLTSTLTREIRLTEDGAAASYGLTKVFWKSDIAAERPITIITPDDRTLYCRPAFLVLQNRANGQNLMLGAVTNRIGEIIASDTVRWTNALDFGPNVSIEYRYLTNGRGMEQNVVLLESPTIPDGWTNSDISIEFWTEWFDSVPTAVETRALTLRGASNSLPAVQADDQQISFGPISKLVAGGRAFTLGAESNSLPVAKTWVLVTNGSVHTFLVESLDLAAAASKLQALPPTSRHASLGRPKSSRSALLQAALDLNGSRFSDQVREVPSPSRDSKFERSGFNSSRFSTSANGSMSGRSRFASSGSVPQRGFVIDFTLLNAVPLPADAVGWWPAGNNATDATTNHNDGTGYSGLAYAPGEVGQSFSLADGAHVHIPDSVSLHLTNVMTAEVWIYCVYDDPIDCFMSKWIADLGSDQRCWNLAVDPDETIGFLVTSNGFNSGAVDIHSSPIDLNVWTHVAATYDGSALKIYLNGNLDVAGAYSHGIFPGTNDFALSGYVGGAAPPTDWNPFYGQIDEATLYRRALSSNEILAIYNAGPAGKYNPNCVAPLTNAIGWWPGDGNGYDLARTNFGTLYDGATYASGQVGQCFNFPGGAAHFRIEDSPDLHFTNAMTAEAWVYSTDQSWVGSVISKWAVLGYSDQATFDLAVNPDGALGFLITSNGVNSGGVWIHSYDPVPLNQWTHVAGTYDGSYLRVYVNGDLEGEAAYSHGIFPGTNSLTISGFTGGTDPGSGIDSSSFIGLIDEPTLYNRALSGVEITAIYAAGSAGKCKVDADSDGLTTIQEAWLGTLDSNNDYDNDGVLDGMELFQGRQPKTAGGIVDTNQLIKLEVYTPLR